MRSNITCQHINTIKDENGTTTCADCYINFGKSFFKEEYTTNYNGPFKGVKSPFYKTLEKFGIYDQNISKITEIIFNKTSKKKIIKGTNKLAILCASVYYAYYYLENPKDIEDILTIFNINSKAGNKGLKQCQVALQEEPLTEGQIYSYIVTHKENLRELIQRYNISLKYFNDIEKIIVICHQKKNKILNKNVNGLWISCIFFWLLKENPRIDPEEFLSLSEYSFLSLQQLKSNLTYLKKIING